MKNEKQNNAFVEVRKNGNYTNLYITIDLKNGDKVDFQIKPFVKDNNVLKKLLYKISVNLEAK